MFMSCSLLVSIVGLFTIRQKRIRGGSTYAECNSGPLKEHLLLARPRHNRISAAAQTPHTVYIELDGGCRQTGRQEARNERDRMEDGREGARGEWGGREQREGRA